MGRLIDIARKSKLMDIEVEFNGEVISFNLAKELKVDENTINKELKNQPTHYGFLSLLQKRLLKRKDDAESRYKKIWASIFLKKKKEKDPGSGRPYSNDVAKEFANKSPKYLVALKDYNKVKEDLGMITSCVESFEQRSSLVQSLSANLRKEN